MYTDIEMGRRGNRKPTSISRPSNKTTMLKKHMNEQNGKTAFSVTKLMILMSFKTGLSPKGVFRFWSFPGF